MNIAIYAAVFIIAAGILGFVFKPTEEQQRPLAPEPGAPADTHGGHDHHH